MRALLESELLVVVDEAYYEFCGETVSGLIAEYENLVVLRTMSKWAGLAGIRAGYAIASPAVINSIIAIKQPYNLSRAGEAAILASLEDAERLLSNIQLLNEERERMSSLLQALPGVNPWPSCCNFVLCQFPPGRAVAVFDGLIGRGIYVRRFDSHRLSDFLRISVGKPEQTDALIRSITELV